ncbi:MAG TPA: hypothetical protein VE666_12780 [Mycobacterium sp.]|nr:hypothetical protein [Mycobacterium sp.]
MSRLHRLAPVIGLFVLAPFVGEFLLGNISVQGLVFGVLLAPMYGGGAVLVRELARRYGRGWPTIASLACAYALIEEGPLDQLMWNDRYPGVDDFHTATYVPALGTSVELIQTVVALHAVWSICVPIALIETFVPSRRTTPWLGRFGLAVVATIYVLGAALVFWGNYYESHFIGPAGPQIVIGIAIVGLVIAAFAIRSRQLPFLDTRAPSPWLVGAAALIATSAYWVMSGLSSATWSEWVGVAIWCAIVAVGVPMISRWSRQLGWGARHRFALAAGATLTYVWMAFPAVPEGGVSLAVDLISNVVFGSIAVVLLLFAGRSAARQDAAILGSTTQEGYQGQRNAVLRRRLKTSSNRR